MSEEKHNFCQLTLTSDVIGLKYSYMKCTCERKMETCKYFYPSEGSSPEHMYCWYYTYDDNPVCQCQEARTDAELMKKLEDI